MRYVLSVLKRYRCEISVIYVYIVIAQLIFLLEPFILGKAIDGLLAHDFTFLWILLGAHMVEHLLVYKQMVYDTRVYTRVYNDIVREYLDRDRESDTSARVARTEMLHTVVDFIENHLHYYISAVITIVGSLYFVFIQHSTTGWVMLACLPFVLLIVRVFYKKISQAMRVGNSHYEQKFGIMDTGNDGLITGFFQRRRRVVIMQSTLSARHWFSLKFTRTAFLILALAVFTQDSVGLSHGEAVSVYTYISNFLMSLMSVPVFVDIYTRIRDVVGRIG